MAAHPRVDLIDLRRKRVTGSQVASKKQNGVRVEWHLLSANPLMRKEDRLQMLKWSCETTPAAKETPATREAGLAGMNCQPRPS